MSLLPPLPLDLHTASKWINLPQCVWWRNHNPVCKCFLCRFLCVLCSRKPIWRRIGETPENCTERESYWTWLKNPCELWLLEPKHCSRENKILYTTASVGGFIRRARRFSSRMGLTPPQYRNFASFRDCSCVTSGNVFSCQRHVRHLGLNLYYYSDFFGYDFYCVRTIY